VKIRSSVWAALLHAAVRWYKYKMEE